MAKTRCPCAKARFWLGEIATRVWLLLADPFQSITARVPSSTNAPASSSLLTSNCTERRSASA